MQLLDEIQPSGFLPITAGNVREDELLDVYQNAPLFRELRISRALRQLTRPRFCDDRRLPRGGTALYLPTSVGEQSAV